jgi:hypothetical protein
MEATTVLRPGSRRGDIFAGLDDTDSAMREWQVPLGGSDGGGGAASGGPGAWPIPTAITVT